MKLSTVTLLTFLANAICTSSANVQFPSRSLRRLDDSSDDEEGVSKRECELEIDDGVEVEFGCKSKIKSELMKMEDKIKFKVKYDEKGLKVKVKYEQEIKTKTPKEEEEGSVDTAENREDRLLADQKQSTETEYEVVFDKMIEYSKADPSSVTTTSSQAYEWGKDRIVNSIDLTTMAPFSGVTTKDNGDYTWTISTIDGIVTFIFTISPSGENTEVTANSIKIDIDIKGYSWMESDSNAAILANVETEVDVDIDYSDDEETKPSDVVIDFGNTVDPSALRPFGEFTWARDAVVTQSVNSTNVTDTDVSISTQNVSTNQTIGGNETGTVEAASATIQVVATSASDGYGIAFSFVGDMAKSAEEIFWDPEAGIGYAEGSGSKAFTSTLALACIATAWFFNI